MGLSMHLFSRVQSVGSVISVSVCPSSSRLLDTCCSLTAGSPFLVICSLLVFPRIVIYSLARSYTTFRFFISVLERSSGISYLTTSSSMAILRPLMFVGMIYFPSYFIRPPSPKVNVLSDSSGPLISVLPPSPSLSM